MIRSQRVLAMAASSWRQGLRKVWLGAVRPLGASHGVLSFSVSAWNCSCPVAQAVVYHEHGEPDRVLKVSDLPGGNSLQNGQVLVKMLAAPINPSDINRVEGVYPVRPPIPAVGGSEGVGEVTAVGRNVKSVAVGDWVVPAEHGMIGTWRTHVVAEESAWCKIRNDVPVEYAATISVNPCTALRMLQDFVPPHAGDVVVQNGATSMVGQCVIQLARHFGLQTLNIVRDRPDLNTVKSQLITLGATNVLSVSEFNAQDKSSLLDGRTARLGLNCVGGSAASAVIKLLGEGGTMVTYGGMSKKPVTVSTSSFIFKDVRLQGFWLTKWIKTHPREDTLEMIDFLLGLVKDGSLHYPLEKIPFSQFSTALDKAMGKQGSSEKQLLVFD